MSMKRTIFEIPANLKEHAIQWLDERSLFYEANEIENTTLIEIAITHNKNQDFLLAHFEDEVNQLV